MTKRKLHRGDGQVSFDAARSRYRITYQLNTPEGRKQVRAWFRTESEAFDALRERTVDAERGTHGDKRITLAQWLQDERLDIREEARWIVGKHFTALFPKRLAEITPGDLRRAQKRLLGLDLSNDTVNDYMRAFALVLNRASEDGLLASVPKLPRSERLANTVNRLELSDAERAQLLAAFSNRKAFGATFDKLASAQDVERAWSRFQRFRRVYTLALECGLARKDLLALRWEQIDLKKRVLTGTRAKTDRPFQVALSDAALAVLQEIRKDKLQTALVLTTEAGEAYTPTMIVDQWTRLKKVAKITRRLRFHDLRFSFGQRLADAGLSDAMIAATLGHAPNSTMPRRYAQPDPSVHLARVREALEAR